MKPNYWQNLTENAKEGYRRRLEQTLMKDQKMRKEVAKELKGLKIRFHRPDGSQRKYKANDLKATPKYVSSHFAIS